MNARAFSNETRRFSRCGRGNWSSSCVRRSSIRVNSDFKDSLGPSSLSEAIMFSSSLPRRFCSRSSVAELASALLWVSSADSIRAFNASQKHSIADSSGACASMRLTRCSTSRVSSKASSIPREQLHFRWSYRKVLHLRNRPPRSTLPDTTNGLPHSSQNRRPEKSEIGADLSRLPDPAILGIPRNFRVLTMDRARSHCSVVTIASTM